MPKLKFVEIKKIEEYFQMQGGHILDFNNRTLQEFILDTINIDIYSSSGYEEYSSKANKMRQIIRQESHTNVAQLLEELIEYKKLFTYDNDKALESEIRNIIQRLKNTTNVLEPANNTNNDLDSNKTDKVRKVFISYSHKDSDIADHIEQRLSNHQNLVITRDINRIQYMDSLSDFMQSIREHDIVISLVTDSYLKSLNCMYEVSELMKETNYQNKLYPIIISDRDTLFYSSHKKLEFKKAELYSTNNRMEYINFWDKEYKQTEKIIQTMDVRPALTTHPYHDLLKMDSILFSISSFIHSLADTLGKDFTDIDNKDFKDIVSI